MDHTPGGRRVPHPETANLTDEMQRCIEDCLDCHAICLTTSQYCLQLGGEHAHVTHMRTLLDCAEICQTGANFMLRGSPLHAATCAVCAEACTRCADECARFDADPQMQACADLCRQCADSCSEMASMAGGHMQHHHEDFDEPPI